MKLKPCPFCGGEATLKDFTGDEYCPGYAVQCNNGDTRNCGICGTPIYAEKEQAIKAWNTRKDLPSNIVDLDKVDVEKLADILWYKLPPTKEQLEDIDFLETEEAKIQRVKRLKEYRREAVTAILDELRGEE